MQLAHRAQFRLDLDGKTAVHEPAVHTATIYDMRRPARTGGPEPSTVQAERVTHERVLGGCCWNSRHPSPTGPSSLRRQPEATANYVDQGVLRHQRRSIERNCVAMPTVAPTAHEPPTMSPPTSNDRPPGRGSGGNSVTKLTVNITPRATAALDAAATANSETKTNVVNRSIQAYAFLTRMLNEGWDLVLRDNDGREQRVQFL